MVPSRDAVVALMNSRVSRRRRGLTLMEVAISSLLVATVLLTSLTTTANWRRFHHTTLERETSRRLANELISEIVSTSFIDPAQASPIAFGREAGEGSSNRTSWDDVDDYHGSIENSVQDKSGNIIAAAVGYTRSVTISAASATNDAPGYAVSANVSQPLRRIVVSVTGPSGASTTLTCLKSNLATQFPSAFDHIRSLTVSVSDSGTTMVRTTATMNQPEVLP